MNLFLIRVDATKDMGLGHFMRQIAFSDHLFSINITPCFISSGTYDKSLLKLLNSKKIPYQSNIKNSYYLLKKTEYKGIIFDGYHFQKEEQTQCMKTGKLTIIFDDYAPKPINAHAIINQNNTELNLYKMSTYRKLFLGPAYSMIRKEIQSLKLKPLQNTAKNCFVFFGGSDPYNYTLDFLKHIYFHYVSPPHLNIVISSINTHLHVLKKFLESTALSYHLYINPPQLPSLMQNSDCAVVSAGTIVWELAHFSTPLLVFPLYENQSYIKKTLSDNNAALLSYFSESKTLTKNLNDLFSNPQKRKKLSLNIGNLSKPRIDDITSWIKKNTWSVVPFQNVSSKTSQLILYWRNHNSIRKHMKNSILISLESHLNFIKNLTNDPHNKYWILKTNEHYIGTISITKIDTINSHAEIGMYLSPDYVGQGYGHILMDSIKTIAHCELNINVLQLYVQSRNLSARALYEKSGFTYTLKTEKDFLEMEYNELTN